MGDSLEYEKQELYKNYKILPDTLIAKILDSTLSKCKEHQNEKPSFDEIKKYIIEVIKELLINDIRQIDSSEKALKKIPGEINNSVKIQNVFNSLKTFQEKLGKMEEIKFNYINISKRVRSKSTPPFTHKLASNKSFKIIRHRSLINIKIPTEIKNTTDFDLNKNDIESNLNKLDVNVENVLSHVNFVKNQNDAILLENEIGFSQSVDEMVLEKIGDFKQKRRGRPKSKLNRNRISKDSFLKSKNINIEKLKTYHKNSENKILDEYLRNEVKAKLNANNELLGFIFDNKRESIDIQDRIEPQKINNFRKDNLQILTTQNNILSSLASFINVLSNDKKCRSKNKHKKITANSSETNQNLINSSTRLTRSKSRSRVKHGPNDILNKSLHVNENSSVDEVLDNFEDKINILTSTPKKGNSRNGGKTENTTSTFKRRSRSHSRSSFRYVLTNEKLQKNNSKAPIKINNSENEWQSIENSDTEDEEFSFFENSNVEEIFHKNHNSFPLRRRARSRPNIKTRKNNIQSNITLTEDETSSIVNQINSALLEKSLEESDKGISKTLESNIITGKKSLIPNCDTSLNSLIPNRNADTAKSKIISPSFTQVIKNTKNEMKRNLELKIGDSVWAKIGRHTFWPALIISDPETGEYKKRKALHSHFTYHVRFFGDKGRRSWVTQILPYINADDLTNFLEKHNEKKVKGVAPFLREYFIVRAHEKVKWQIAVEEAELIKNEPIAKKLDFFKATENNEMSSKKAGVKRKADFEVDNFTHKKRKINSSLVDETLDFVIQKYSQENIEDGVSVNETAKSPQKHKTSMNNSNKYSQEKTNKSPKKLRTSLSKTKNNRDEDNAIKTNKSLKKSKTSLNENSTFWQQNTSDGDKISSSKNTKKPRSSLNKLDTSDAIVKKDAKKDITDNSPEEKMLEEKLMYSPIKKETESNDKNSKSTNKRKSSKKINISSQRRKKLNRESTESNDFCLELCEISRSSLNTIQQNIELTPINIKIEPMEIPNIKDETISSKELTPSPQIKNGNILKKPDTLMLSEIASQILDMIKNQMKSARSHIFKGISKHRVCQVCEKSNGIIQKCKGPCNGVYHDSCILDILLNLAQCEENVEIKKEDEQVQIITYSSKKPINPLFLTPTHAKLPLNEQIDKKMEELMNQIEYHGDLNTSSDENDTATDISLNSSKKKSSKKVKKQNIKKHVTAETDDDSTSESTITSYNSKEQFKCSLCRDKILPLCFICQRKTNKSGSQFRQKCSLNGCGKFYHLDCLNVWRQTQWAFVLQGKSKGDTLDSFACPMHICHTCSSENFCSMGRCPNDILVKCLRCPATYHNSSHCIPAGTEILSTTQVVCPRHANFESKSHRICNTTWCFICSKGGNLICCETCPTSVHLECLPIHFNQEDQYICEDCESGRFPLYNDLVWVKLGNYPWWPAVILFPREVPFNINDLPHKRGDFVVRFFGTYDYRWVNRGRVFLYEEGDKGDLKNKKLDSVFSNALIEIAAAYCLKKESKINREEEANNGLKPPTYIRIKVNRPVGNVKMPEGDLSNTCTPCDCNPNDNNPCGPESSCINRILMTECNPDICPAGQNCQNQLFEKRSYPNVEPYRTAGRGWGLRTLESLKKDQFVIEYVGEVIDDEECQRRIKRMHQQKDENYYFLTIDNNRIIDAGPKGNYARFINHSCKPNCDTQKWTVNGGTRVGLFANQDIPAGSELTFNYNFECIGEQKKVCRCGAPNCSGYIGVKPEAEKTQRKGDTKRKKKTSSTLLKETLPCFLCNRTGDVFKCSNKICSKWFHQKCAGLDNWPDEMKWVCPCHNCNVCSKRTVRSCIYCTNSYCPEHADGNVNYRPEKGFICSDHMKKSPPRKAKKSVAKGKKKSFKIKFKQKEESSTDDNNTNKIKKENDKESFQSTEETLEKHNLPLS